MTESKTLPLRSQVPIDETWDLESIFQTPEDWEAAGEELTGYIPKLAAYQGKLKDPPTRARARAIIKHLFNHH